ncbi:MAG: H4MPT-linked C1 transfer pathway protein, partial [Thauera propionica]|nr:H4MPT-linked C1 transfer pathway protein [Thauera propionica]
TPLCALARRIAFEGREYNVMNEFFATTADIFRLTGELAPEHDQYPAADGAGKDAEATRQRIARMIGRDASDADASAWLRFASAWREAMLAEIDCNLARVLSRFSSPTPAVPRPTVVGAGCGLFLGEALARRHDLPFAHFAGLVPADETCRTWVDTCAPSVAVALLFARAVA